MGGGLEAWREAGYPVEPIRADITTWRLTS